MTEAKQETYRTKTEYWHNIQCTKVAIINFIFKTRVFHYRGILNKHCYIYWDANSCLTTSMILIWENRFHNLTQCITNNYNTLKLME